MKTIDTDLAEKTPELFLSTYSDEISKLAEKYDKLGSLRSWAVVWRPSVMRGCITWHILFVFEDGIVQVSRNWQQRVFHLNHLDHSP